MPKKFSFPESLIMLLMTAFADILEIFVMGIGIIPIITPISIGISWLVNTFVFGTLIVWFIIKGERGLWAIAGSLLEYIPFLNVLPLRTATCAIAIYLANHPQIKQVATSHAKPKKKTNNKNKSKDNTPQNPNQELKQSA